MQLLTLGGDPRASAGPRDPPGRRPAALSSRRVQTTRAPPAGTSVIARRRVHSPRRQTLPRGSRGADRTASCAASAASRASRTTPRCSGGCRRRTGSRRTCRVPGRENARGGTRAAGVDARVAVGQIDRGHHARARRAAHARRRQTAPATAARRRARPGAPERLAMTACMYSSPVARVDLGQQARRSLPDCGRAARSPRRWRSPWSRARRTAARRPSRSSPSVIASPSSSRACSSSDMMSSRSARSACSRRRASRRRSDRPAAPAPGRAHRGRSRSGAISGAASSAGASVPRAGRSPRSARTYARPARRRPRAGSPRA